MKHPNRIYPPTASEILGEILIEERESAIKANKDRQWAKLNPNRLASDELLLQQMQDARRDHPELFGDDGPLTELANRISARIQKGGRVNEFASPAYNTADDLDAPF